jgi:hypothetical protein
MEKSYCGKVFCGKAVLVMLAGNRLWIKHASQTYWLDLVIATKQPKREVGGMSFIFKTQIISH